MKIVFSGKGGSGKSTLSWLFINYLAQKEIYVLGIDSDHNNDLIANFNLNQDTIPSIHKNHDQFKQSFDLNPESSWKQLIDSETTPLFRVNPADNFTNTVKIEVSKHINLINVGLGSSDILFSDKCAHGHSAPLKYYLGLLELDQSQWLVVDGVAGVDMINYGLYLGCDLNIVVVENHPNSIRVYQEIKKINQQIGLDTYYIQNKYKDTPISMDPDKCLGKISLENNILGLDYDTISDKTKLELEVIFQNITEKCKPCNHWQRILNFERKRYARN